MSQSTSIAAYQAVKESGFLSGLREEIYDLLHTHGALTQGEIWSMYMSQYQRPSISPRFAELKKMGLIREIGKRECWYSGVESMIWEVTDNMPLVETKREKILRQIEAAKNKIAKLQAELVLEAE